MVTKKNIVFPSWENKKQNAYIKFKPLKCFISSLCAEDKKKRSDGLNWKKQEENKKIITEIKILKINQ